MLEFALLLPVLMFFFIGGAEYARYFLLQQKLDKVATAMADFASAGHSLTRDDLNRYMQGAEEIMKPFDARNLSVVFSGITYSDRAPWPCAGIVAPCVMWSYSPRNSGFMRVGTVGQVATLPAGFVPLIRQNYVTAEITYRYEPILPGSGRYGRALLGDSLYKIALYKVRTSRNPAL